MALESIGDDGEVGKVGSIGRGNIGGGWSGGGLFLSDLEDFDLVGWSGVMEVNEKVGDFSGVRGVGGGAAWLGLRNVLMMRLFVSKGRDADLRLAADVDCIGDGRSGAA